MDFHAAASWGAVWKSTLQGEPGSAFCQLQPPPRAALLFQSTPGSPEHPGSPSAAFSLCLSSPFIPLIHFSCKTPCQHESLAWISYNYYYAFITLLLCSSKGVFYKSCRFSNQLPLNAIARAFFSVGNDYNTWSNEQEDTVRDFP